MLEDAHFFQSLFLNSCHFLASCGANVSSVLSNEDIDATSKRISSESVATPTGELKFLTFIDRFFAPLRAPPSFSPSSYATQRRRGEMAVRRVWLLALPLLLLMGNSCIARPEGPPLRACLDMTPQHGSNLRQTSPNPVTFSWNRTLAPNTVIRPGQYIQGIIIRFSYITCILARV